jgi:hypothetical protein
MDEIRSLNNTLQETVAGSTHNISFTVIKKRERLTHTNYLQNLCLIQQDIFVCRYLLSKI